MIATLAVSTDSSFQDPLVVLVDKWRDEVRIWESTEHDSPEDNASWERREELAKSVREAKPETLAELNAQFDYFRSELGDFISDTLSPDDMALFDSMLVRLGEMSA